MLDSIRHHMGVFAAQEQQILDLLQLEIAAKQNNTGNMTRKKNCIIQEKVGSNKKKKNQL